MTLPTRRRCAAEAALAATVLLVALLPAASGAQQRSEQRTQPRPQPDLSVYLFKLEHQSASEAFDLVRPLLSPRGSVELRAGSNTLVVRDSLASLTRILPVLQAFDHPARDVLVELWLIRAGAPQVSPPPPVTGMPPELLASLREHLPYQTYHLIAESRVRGREGERITFDLGNAYLVRFRLGTVVSQRLRLNEFEVLLEQEGESPASLVRSHLNLWLGRTMVLALAAGEDSPTALMVVVRCELVSAGIPGEL